MDPHIAAAQLNTFRRVCPYLGRTSPATLRRMSTTSIAGVSRLRMRAQACPVLGSAFKLDPQQQRPYASLAGQAEIDEIHRRNGVDKVVSRGQGTGVCPHAHLARAAAEQVANEARGKKQAGPAANPVTHEKASRREGFDYERFYQAELDKKHKDKSYR